jgi:hypothetical protein
MNQKKVRIKAISSTVAAFIIATISVTLVGTTYFFSQGLLKGTTAETFEVVDVFSNMIIVRNAGTQPINNFTVLVDGKEINNQIKEPPIEPGKIGTVVLDLKDVPSGRHELVVMSKSMSTRWTWEFQYVSTTTSTTTTFTTTTEGIHGYSIKSLSEKEKNENPDFEFSNQKTIILNITKHSGFEKYIDLDVIKENETRFLVTYNFNKTILDDILKCKLGAVCGSSRLLGLKDKYFSELSTNDFIKSVDNITTYPVSNLTSGIKPVINSIDLSVSGSFYIDLLDYDSLDISKSIGKKVKIGFNTIELTTVESTNNVGQDSSIALDSNGYAHISYRDTTNYDLRYCNNTLGAWTCTVLDTPANQQGYETSIAIDSNDKVHISHREYPANDLRYCTNAQGTWSCTAVDTAGNVGTQGSIAIDKNDKVHISHRNFTGSYGSLRYCNNTLGTWTCTNAEAGASGIGSFGWFSSIAIDSNNKVHISHQNFTGGKYSLRYCNNTLGTWTCAQIETGNVGLDTSIAIDSNDKVHISHRNNSAAGYAIRYCNNIAGTWSCEKVDTAGILKYTSIAIDNNDKVHISHGDDTNFDLRYCNNTLGSWTCGVVDNLAGSSTDDVYTNGRAIVMKKGRLVDSTSFSPNISISYYDSSGQNLKYARLVNYLTLGPQVDTTPPIVTIESPTNTSYATATVWSNVTLNEAGSWCGLSFDGGSNVTMLNDSATHFYNQTTGLSQGSHNVRFYCNDTAGNMNGSASNKVYFTIDLTPPILILQSPLNQTYASTTIWANVTLNEAGSCLVNNDTNSVNLTMTNTTGKWWYQFTGLSQGGHNFRFYCNDTAGNMNSSLNISFTVDTIPPIVTVQSPSNTTYLTTTVWVNVTLNEAGSWCGYNLDSVASNTTMQNSSGNYNSQITGLSEGGHNVRFYCNDTVGNMNGSIITYFTVGIPPKWSSIKTQPGTGIEYQPEGKYQFNVTWTDNIGVSNVIFEWQGKNISSYLWNNVSKSGDEYYLNITDLAAGTYYYKWYANDTYNNWNYTSLQMYQVKTAPSQTWLYLNWTQGNRSYNKSEIAYIYANCTGCSSGNSINLESNYTGTLSSMIHIHDSGQYNAYNFTDTFNLGLGNYFIRASTSDQNHSFSQKNYTLIVVDEIPPKYSDNSTNSTAAGREIKFSVKWSDNAGLSYAIFGLDNCTGQFKNITNMSLSGITAWSNFTVTVNSTVGCLIKWNVYANDTNNKWNVSENSFNTTPSMISIWNLVIRDVPNEQPIVETITGVAVIISVNVSGDINYVEGNFTWPNGTMVYKNLTEISNKNYTHNWTYVVPYAMSVGTARINVTAYDKSGLKNSTNTTLNILETAVLSLLNDPINFSTVSAGKLVNATEMRGWPLLAVVQGNVPMNLSQAAEGDLMGQTKPNVKIGLNNVTWNTTDYGIFRELTTQFMKIVENIMPNNNQSIYYKLNVPTVEPQYYSGNISIKGEY